MDIELILDSAEIVTPGLTDTVRRILTATARQMYFSLELADVLARRAGGGPEVHITAAADQLLEHLAAIEGTAPADQGVVAVLAHAGAQMLMSGIEMDESR